MLGIKKFKVNINNKDEVFFAKLVHQEEEIYQLVTSTGKEWRHVLTHYKKDSSPTSSSWSEFKIENNTMIAYVNEFGVIQRYSIGYCSEID